MVREGRPGPVRQGRRGPGRARRQGAQRRGPSASRRDSPRPGRLRARRGRVSSTCRAAADASRGGPARPRRPEADRAPVGLPGRCARTVSRRGAPRRGGESWPCSISPHSNRLAPAPARRLDRLHRAVGRPGQDLRPGRRSRQGSQPPGADGFADAREAIRQQLGLDLRKDLLAHLGPKLAFTRRRRRDRRQADPAAAMCWQFTGLTLSVQVRDEPPSPRHSTLIKAINRLIQHSRRPPGGRPAPTPPLTFRKQDGPAPAPTCWISPRLTSPQVLAMSQPTVTLGKDQLVLGATTAAAEQRGPEPRPPTGAGSRPGRSSPWSGGSPRTWSS